MLLDKGTCGVQKLCSRIMDLPHALNDHSKSR